MPPSLVGRDQALWELKEYIEHSTKIVAITGPDGFGKTALAKAYVQEHKHYYTHIAWIDIARNQSLIDAFSTNVQLQDSLMLGVNSLTQDPYQKDKVFQLIMNVFRSLTQPSLLVIDNVGLEIEDTRLLQSLSLPANWKVVMTSAHINLRGIKEYPLEPLQSEDACRLFYRLTRLVEGQDQDLVLKVWEISKGNLRWLNLIAQRLVEQRLSLQECLSLLEDEGASFLQTGYQQLQVVYDLLDQNRLESAFQILLYRKISFFHPIKKEVQDQVKAFRAIETQASQTKVSFQQRMEATAKIRTALLEALKTLEENPFI
ncbi:MAG: ATP-binding protein [Bacteroidota bacterium]